MKSRVLILALLCALFAETTAVRAKKIIKTLVVTGQNNHNWMVSHRVLELILENSGMFTVDLAISPPQGGDMSVFEPEFGAYDLVVLDYNGDDWSGETKTAFLEYVNGGGGVVVYHAANNAFPDWVEYNEMIALGGWGNRDRRAGPYLYLSGGKIVVDDAEGAGGSHGPVHEYYLDVFDANHPIAKGLPSHWMHARDELYDHMRGPGNIRSLLWSAYSSPEKSGTGRNEPLVFTVNYNNARIFHTMMGHAGVSTEDNPAMQCAGFQVTLLRGAEWAATGKVTQRVPKDFPTLDMVSYRLDYKQTTNL